MTPILQLELLEWKPRRPRRIGKTFVETRDDTRLSRQYDRVMRVLLDGKKRTLRQLADESGAPEASASARFREIKANGFPVHSECSPTGGWVYFMDIPS